MSRLNFLLVILLLPVLGGCISSTPQSTDGRLLERVASLDSARLFAASHDGHYVVYVNNGLYLLNLSSGIKQTIAKETPIDLAWSPDSSQFAAIIPTGDYESRLVLYSLPGQLLQEHAIPSAASKLKWGMRGDLLVTGYNLKNFSFGGNLQQFLYRIDGTNVIKTKLADTTLKPGTVKAVAPVLAEVQPVLFSAYGDELVYVYLHDPPEFAPYLAVRSMNWQVGEPKNLLEVPLQKISLAQADIEDAAVVVLPNARHLVETWPQTGASELLPQARYRFIDGRLYEGRDIIGDWGQQAILQLLPAGRYMLSVNGGLYLGRELRTQPPEDFSEEKWNLRRWRANGLITPAEYHEQLTKVMNQG